MADDITQPALGALGWLRWIWRQLTSMRTALMLLLALAVAALPGSVLPQRSIDAGRTSDWIQQHSTLGPVLDRLGFFEVYASPWFAAIYLLLFVALVGCILPRSRAHWRVLRQPPPQTPKRPERLPSGATVEVDGDGVAELERIREVLRGKRYRVVSHETGTLSAETGYLKETGNLLFHLALVGIIVGVAIGYLFGWKGDVILPEGSTFVNTPIRYDTPVNGGPWVSDSDLKPFVVSLDRLDADFEQTTQGKGQFGTPRDFTAYVRYRDAPGAAEESSTIKVNHPLELPGATAFLLGNGYAPHVTVRDAKGEVLYSQATPFLAQDNNYKSVGAIKVPAGTPKELGFSGFFLPTAHIDSSMGPVSVFPQALKPALALSVFEGTLAPGGRPQSVYLLDTTEMTQVSNAEGTDALRVWLEPGQTVTLPGERGSITFDGVTRFAGLSIRHDPGKWLTLAAAVLALIGLITTLVMRRRRVFVRISPLPDEGRSLLRIGGLAKDDDEGLRELVDDLARTLTPSTPTEVAR